MKQRRFKLGLVATSVALLASGAGAQTAPRYNLGDKNVNTPSYAAKTTAMAGQEPATQNDVSSLQNQINILMKRVGELQNELAQAKQTAAQDNQRISTALNMATAAQEWLRANGPSVLSVAKAYPRHIHFVQNIRVNNEQKRETLGITTIPSDDSK